MKPQDSCAWLYMLFCTVLLIVSPVLSVQAADSTADRHLVLVSFDGFRSDYPALWGLEHFRQIAVEGVAATSLVPSYPSKTFPNHYSIVTGLYPGHHGLVDNSFYSPATGSRYSIGDRAAVEDPRYYGGLPLWQTLQAQGIKTASYFWVGSEAPLHGQYPTFYHRYDEKVPDEARIEQVLQWLTLPDEERPRFITVYFSFVDSIAHDSGPLSVETRAAAQRADQLLGKLMEGISKLPMDIELLVVSDHGMSPIVHVPETYIDISTLGLDESDGTLILGQTQAQLHVREPERVEAIYQELRAQNGSFTVYRKQDTPAHWHYSSHDNIGDILLVVHPGHVITRSLAAEFSAESRPTGSIFGVHGYDAQDLPELHGIFYAWGPAFRKGLAIGSFENIHVFPLISRLFSLPDSGEIDGNPAVLMPIVAE